MALPCGAISPVKFQSTLWLSYQPRGVALTAEARARLDEHLGGMSHRGECNLEVVIVGVGSRPRLDAGRTGKTLTERERYLAALLGRRSIVKDRIFFISARESDAAGVGPDQVVFEFNGTPAQRGCVVRTN